jgi:hypothetical protein
MLTQRQSISTAGRVGCGNRLEDRFEIPDRDLLSQQLLENFSQLLHRNNLWNDLID